VRTAAVPFSSRSIRPVQAVFLLGLLGPGLARAQAWLPPAGEASFTSAFQYIYAGFHTTASGDKLDRGKMKWNNMSFDLDYGVTDRFTLRFGIPYVVSKYTGSYAHPTSADDGDWHGTFADVRLEARFMAKTKGLVLTPFAAVGAPSHQYETFAHSGAGKGLAELSFGVAAGLLLDPVLPDGYAQARLSYSIPEKVLGISHDRTNLAVEVGYFATAALVVDVFATWQRTHGGWTTDQYPPRTSPDFSYHDQLTQENFLDVGLGASFTVLPSLDVFVNGFTTLRSENTVLSSGIMVGTRIGFSPARMLRKARESGRSKAAKGAGEVPP
jgi:hypothetical protein